MSKHYVIYIPGLGDHRVRGQKLAVDVWWFYSVQGEVYQMLWRDSRHLDVKLELLLKRIDDLLAAGNTVSLVAASAGASAALNAYAARKDKIAGVVLLCGKVHNGDRMHPSVTRRNTSFGQSLDRLPEALDQLDRQHRRRILSAHPLADESVPVADTRIPGTHERTMPVMGHFFGIAYGLTIFAPIALGFLKRQAKTQAKP